LIGTSSRRIARPPVPLMMRMLTAASAADRGYASKDRYWAALDRDEAAGDRVLLHPPR
jgi:hypothetical protein